MRSASCCSDIAGALLDAFAQAMAERDAFVEDKARAAPAALCFRSLFQISEDAALEVIDLGKSPREQERTGLLAADATGAEHRNLPMLRRVERLGGKILELAEARNLGIDRAVERAQCDLEAVAGVDHERVGRRDQRIPVARLDIGADLPRRIGNGCAERDDLPLQPHLETS